LNKFYSFSKVSPENQKSIVRVFEEISSNKIVRVVVLISDSETNQKANLEFNQIVCKLIENCSVPVILAVKGNVNFELAESARLCVASERAKFVSPETKRSNNSSDEKISSQKALKIGLVNKVVVVSEVEKEAYSMAEKISHLAPLAIHACLEAVVSGLEMSLEDGLNLEIELFSRLFESEDMREGTQAFLEKRKPIFRGK
jgi:enoyl-CoA hydratase/carnithine racemase